MYSTNRPLDFYVLYRGKQALRFLFDRHKRWWLQWEADRQLWSLEQLWEELLWKPWCSHQIRASCRRAEELLRTASVGLVQQPYKNPKVQYFKFLEWIIATYHLDPEEAQSLVANPFDLNELWVSCFFVFIPFIVSVFWCKAESKLVVLPTCIQMLWLLFHMVSYQIQKHGTLSKDSKAASYHTPYWPASLVHNIIYVYILCARNLILQGIWCSKTSLTLQSIIYPLKSLWSNYMKETSYLNKKCSFCFSCDFKKQKKSDCDCFLSRV